MIKINETLSLRPWRFGDEVYLQKVADDFQVAKTLRDMFPYPYTIQDAAEWIKLNESKKASEFLAICIEDIPIGGISLIQQGINHKHVYELGYWLGSKFWGQNIVTLAVINYIQYFISSQNMPIIRIFATTASTNLASCRVLEKAGFTKEGILKSNIIFRDGNICDTVVFAQIHTKQAQIG